MFIKMLRFLVNLVFKPLGLEFLAAPKTKRTRTPKRELRCAHCGLPFPAFTQRQLVCRARRCVKARRKFLYVARRDRRDRVQADAILKREGY